MTNNSTTPNHVQAVSPKKTTKQLTATYELLYAEVQARIEEMHHLELALDRCEGQVKQIEEEARPLAEEYRKLQKEAEPRAKILSQLAEMGIGAGLDYLDYRTVMESPYVVNRFSSTPDEEDIPF